MKIGTILLDFRDRVYYVRYTKHIHVKVTYSSWKVNESFHSCQLKGKHLLLQEQSFFPWVDQIYKHFVVWWKTQHLFSFVKKEKARTCDNTPVRSSLSGAVRKMPFINLSHSVLENVMVLYNTIVSTLSVTCTHDIFLQRNWRKRIKGSTADSSGIFVS